MAPRTETAERSCLVTREAQPTAGLIRFVQDPGGRVVPDIRGKLPGRGVWVSGRREVLAEAVRRKLFGRGFKTEVEVDADLPDWVDRLLLEQALSALSMARKAGKVVTGFGKVTTAAARGQVVAVIHATEAADDGKRKVAQGLRRRARAEREGDEPFDDEDDEVETAPEAVEVDPAALPRVIDGLFSGAELDLALGGANVVHAALLAGGASTSFLLHAAALARFRGGSPDTDWIAGS